MGRRLRQKYLHILYTLYARQILCLTDRAHIILQKRNAFVFSVFRFLLNRTKEKKEEKEL